jgi:hypothetical protein
VARRRNGIELRRRKALSTTHEIDKGDIVDRVSAVFPIDRNGEIRPHVDEIATNALA